MTTPPQWLSRDHWQALYDDFAHRPLSITTIVLFFADIGLLAVGWTLWQRGTLLGIATGWSILMLALVQLYLILHEAAHNAVSRRKWLNNLIGNACGWTFGLPFYTRQRNHLMHHVWAAHPTGDPENAKMIEKMSVMTESQARKVEFIWRNWLPVITFNHIVATWRGPFVEASRGHTSPRFEREMRYQKAYAVGYVAFFSLLVATSNIGSFLTWFVPPWILLLVAMELLNLPHHAEAPLLDAKEKPLPYWRQHEVTHNCGHVPIWSRCVIMNFNLHIAHHAFPMVPWYRLPSLDRLAHQRSGAPQQRFKNEFAWHVVNRKRPLMEVMGHFFDKRQRASTALEVTQ